MPPPLPRCSGWAYSSLISPSRVSLPRKGHRVGLHIVLFEACSAFTRVAACTLARSPIRDPLSEGFRHFVASMPAPVASGWSKSPGGACTHWKAPPCHGAHPKPSLKRQTPADRKDELPPQAALSDQVGMDELREMERSDEGLNTQPLGDYASGQPHKSHVRSNRNRSNTDFR